MKYLDFQSFSHIAELCQRQNGKTTEAVKETLNRLMNIDGPAQIMFVSYSPAMVNNHIRNVFQGFLNKAPKDYRINIEINNQSLLRFDSMTGQKSVRFSTFVAIPLVARGITLDDIIFDLDLPSMFKNLSHERFFDVFQVIAPIFNRK